MNSHLEEEQDLNKADDKSKKSKKYILDMFPYPSGEGLHVGHLEGYTATDIYSRYMRLQGFNVLHPIGWDAFGLPAENYAIKTSIHPAETTKKSIINFKHQMELSGLSYDWSREINTSDPNYYKWTQWIFLQLYKKGLAYKKKAPVNWCDSCKTVLANEQVVDAKCERCGNQVIQKDLEQWFFKVTEYAEELLNEIDKMDWPEALKHAQRNWIGKSEGALINFAVILEGSASWRRPIESDGKRDPIPLTSLGVHGEEKIKVFTTRSDTLFGATYLVVAPEHPFVANRKLQIANWSDVEDYINKAKTKNKLERTDLAKEKTGVELKGVKAVNPGSKEEIPIWIADYVLTDYGTGAIMAVPAHDERDFEFATKYKLPIKQVIEPVFVQTWEPGAVKEGLPFIEREAITAIVKHWSEDKYIGLKWKKVDWQTFITGGPENGQTPEEGAISEIIEETGYLHPKLIKTLPRAHSKFFHVPKQVNRFAHFTVLYFELQDDARTEISSEEKDNHDVIWLTPEELDKFLTPDSHKYNWLTMKNGYNVYTGEGVLTSSDKFNGMSSEEAKDKIIKAVGGKKQTQYKIRDWLISRQRYWGVPIPIIYCRKCWENSKSQIPISKQIPNSNDQNSNIITTIISGVEYATIPVLEKDLPVVLPDDVDFKPTGESPLARSKKFHDVKCQKCGSDARRESDTMDSFVCSSWYFLRYADPQNDKEFASKANLKKWLPVDLYIGGMEHAVGHLIYARFITKALADLGYLNFREPFLKIRNQGIILAEDSRKMSKRWGNVINPDDVVKEYGADTLRMYEMFMGPLEDMKPWDSKGIIGVKRFLDRIYEYVIKLQVKFGDDFFQKWLKNETVETDKQILILLNKTIKKITEDIENLRFNTAISQLMILRNSFYLIERGDINQINVRKFETAKGIIIKKSDFEKFLIILSPFAPFLAEELWKKLGHQKSIFKEKWPEYDKKLVIDEEVTIAIQVNGKLRDTIEVERGISEKELKSMTYKLPNVNKYIEGKEIKKFIYIKDRLVNIVV